MAKKVVAIVKLQCPAGQANPSPPVGPALGQHGVNIMEFCKAFNARTQDKQGLIIPAVITVYADRSLHLRAADAAGVGAAQARREDRQGLGRAEPHEGRHGDARPGARDRRVEGAGSQRPRRGGRRAKIVAGTARSMGLDVVEG